MAIATNKNRRELAWLIVLAWSLLVLIYRVPDSLDLSRYYEDVRSFSGNALQYLRYSLDTNYDFIYIFSLKMLYDLGVPMGIGTIAYVSLYFIIALKIVFYAWGKLDGSPIPFMVTACICLLQPFSRIVCVSRTTAALCFLYIAFFYFYKRKNVYAATFAALAVLTHVSMVMFILVILLGAFINPMLEKGNKKGAVVTLAVGVVALIALSTFFSSFIDVLSVSDIADTRYSQYVDTGRDTSNYLLQSNVSKGVRANMAVVIIFNAILLFYDKKWDIFSSILLVSEIITVFFVASPLSFLSVRFSMFITPFFGMVLCKDYMYNNRRKRILNMLIYLVFFTQLWEIYNSRVDFF